MRKQSIAIVGGGLSGALVALHCLDRMAELLPETPVTLHWIEPRKKLGRGIAYSTENSAHILNVPAARMALSPDAPSHFYDWAHAKDATIQPGSFLPRKLYGEYLGEKIAERLARIPSDSVVRHECEAIGLQDLGTRFNLSLADGTTVACDRVVLATGNFRPGDVPIANTSFYSSDRYVKDPRDEETLKRAISTLSPDARVLILGSGLTMLDTALTLSSEKPDFRLTAFSRRGLLSQVHAPSPVLPAWNPAPGGRLLEILRAVKKHAREKGSEWRSVIDAMRSEIPSLWSGLDAGDRRQFIRHLQPFWDMHRHRVAPEVHAKISALREKGVLTLQAGKLIDLREENGAVSATLRKRGEESAITANFDLVVNCTGPEANLRKARSPLLTNLLDQGLVRTDELQLGLDAEENGALRDRTGKATQRLFTLGPPLKGMLWETTAAPEIRVQAKKLAHLLMDQRS